MILRLAVGAAVLVLALDGGTYSLVSRHSLAIAVWWTILVGVALGLLPRARLGAATAMVGGLLTGFCAWTAASAAWAASAEEAFLEFDRAALFLGVFALVALSARREEAGTWCDGIAIGLVGVAAVALSSRLFPGVVGDDDVIRFLPDARGRLSFPVNYWNGLGILLALAVPLLLRAAVTARHPPVRALAVAPLPALSAALYLTSSRGAAVTALVGAGAFLALTHERWPASAAAAVGAAGSVAAVAVLASRPDLANAVGDAPSRQGPTAAALIALTCVATGAAYGFAGRVLGRTRIPPRVGWALAGAAVVAVVAATIAADPAERFEAFKRTPDQVSLPRGGFASTHLLSGGGSGRWQFWAAAADEFRADPLTGGAAGSYEAWWAEHGSFAYFVRDAHSLYLETLAELGLPGLLLVGGAFGAGLFFGVRGIRKANDRVTTAALTATFAAYAFGAGIDWMWELTVVSVVGVACLALLTGAGGGPPSPRPALRLAVPSAAAVMICLQALPLLTQLQMQESQAAVARGDGIRAVDEAKAATRLEPWAASPRVQLALVYEQSNTLRLARRAIAAALARDRSDWRTWLVAARIEAKSGDLPAARRSLARAIELNPRSPLFQRRRP
jgi:O-Antigen ligase